MNPHAALCLSVQMVSRGELDLDFAPPFWFKLVVEKTYSFKDFLKACWSQYSWWVADTALLKYWSTLDQCFIRLNDDNAAQILHFQTAIERFGKLKLEVVRKPLQHELAKTKGKGGQLPPLPRRSSPGGSTSQPSGSTS